ncbi:MAG: radical SAM protein, partial [Myxococcota bacterium]|nr:radical SAM protein [Myxococcota bacterium]
TLRDDLAVIIERAAEGGNLVSLATNGSRIDAALADALVRAGLGHVDVALDSVTPELHDHNRGRSGAHERAVRAIQLLDEARRRHGARMYINAAAVVAGFNVHELPALAAWVADSGADNLLLQPVMPPFWSTHDHGWLVASELWPRDRETTDEAIDALVAIKRDGGPIDNGVEQLEGIRRYFDEAATGEPLVDPALAVTPAPPGELPTRIDRCEIGRKSINVNHLGDVRICHEMPPVGNLTEQTLYEAWSSPQANRVRELIARCHRDCYLLNCNYCD